MYKEIKNKLQLFFKYRLLKVKTVEINKTVFHGVP